MAVSEYPPEAWQRLGRLLKSRRVHIDPAYKNRGAFCKATGLNYKLVQEVEGHTRTTFGDDTFALFETGYRLVEGSIRRALAGGDLEPTDRGADTLSVAAEAKAPAAETPAPEIKDPTPTEAALLSYIAAMQQELANVNAKIEAQGGKLDEQGGKIDELLERRQQKSA